MNFITCQVNVLCLWKAFTSLFIHEEERFAIPILDSVVGTTTTYILSPHKLGCNSISVMLQDVKGLIIIIK
jgi:hypothetical protein